MKAGQIIALIKAFGGGSGGGGGSDTVILHRNPDTWALDKTWNEIKTALVAGKRVILPFGDDIEGDYGQMVACRATSGDYYAVVFTNTSAEGVAIWQAFCEGADDYPFFD